MIDGIIKKKAPLNKDEISYLASLHQDKDSYVVNNYALKTIQKASPNFEKEAFDTAFFIGKLIAKQDVNSIYDCYKGMLSFFAKGNETLIPTFNLIFISYIQIGLRLIRKGVSRK